MVHKLMLHLLMRVGLILILLTNSIFWGGGLHGQVTIGSNVRANAGSLLDIKSTNTVGRNSDKGMMLPRVNLITVGTLTPENINDPGTPVFTGDDIHTGLWVYNMTDNTGYTTRDDVDVLCPGPYSWTGSRWERLWPVCDCEYSIRGRDGNIYNIVCHDFENVPYLQALSICKTIADKRYTYHLMTYDEYEQIWSQPIFADGQETSDRSFTQGEYYFIQKKSDIVSPIGWVTMAFELTDGSGKREVLGLNRGTVSSLTSGYFPGGTPLGALFGKGTVRCVRDK